MKVCVGSKNPAKVSAVVIAFQETQVEVTSLDVSSGVSAQPFSDEETILGAITRAKNAKDLSGAEIGIGLEGGVVKTVNDIYVCNWGALVSDGNQPIIAGGARIPLPKEIGDRLLNGEELGPIMDEYTNKQNIRKREGAIGVFTNERITRSEMFVHIMRMLIGQYEYQLKND
ncbi:DUF84 family protein [Peribacillus acanthi]|uniref:DUF84 family protein n=1 Tax=Peribacillus acanthi TaxID=2171554 RepID=UPI000D3E61A8|nr:DUF84 family protein [Peribacillus acanthi]